MSGSSTSYKILKKQYDSIKNSVVITPQVTPSTSRPHCNLATVNVASGPALRGKLILL
jgi:hypothetical protein